ncbi:hypothetical protein ACFVZ3_34825 [Kitasatospora purpeofusca]|uniref:hypothetical protein n=1 Tax=Kitasatospora purpeofusca TaxID=67352 RepID=UPI003693D36A
MGSRPLRLPTPPAARLGPGGSREQEVSLVDFSLRLLSTRRNGVGERLAQVG